MKITKAQFPDKEWPFTVDTVYVTMKESGPIRVLLIRFHLARYALNGMAENYHWMPIPERYKIRHHNSEYMILFVRFNWFIKYCLDNVKKS